MNKYLLSVDIEGCTGVINKEFANQDGKYYDFARRYMTSDVNAVVEGILSADSNAWVVVRDAHGDAVNLDLETLHPQANLIQGWGNDCNMLTGLDSDFKGVFLVGYHAGGQNNLAVLGHALSSKTHYIKVNGKLVDEAGLAGLYASAFKVPIAFISGDDYAVNAAREQLGDDIVGVVVKQSYARDCAMSLPLGAARELLEKSSAEAVNKLHQGKFTFFEFDSPVTLELGLYNIGFGISVIQKLATILSFDKTYKFDTEHFTITFSADTILELLQRLNLLMQLVYGMR